MLLQPEFMGACCSLYGSWLHRAFFTVGLIVAQCQAEAPCAMAFTLTLFRPRALNIFPLAHHRKSTRQSMGDDERFFLLVHLFYLLVMSHITSNLLILEFVDTPSLEGINALLGFIKIKFWNPLDSYFWKKDSSSFMLSSFSTLSSE